MLDLTITILCYPPHVKLLKGNLESIKKAMGSHYHFPVVVLNTQADEKNIKEVEKIVQSVQLPELRIIHTPKALPIGQSRNILFHETHTQWVMFNDADTILACDYFEQLDRFSKKHTLKNVHAIAGNIGMASYSTYGVYEGIMDLFVLCESIKDFTPVVFQMYVSMLKKHHQADAYITSVHKELQTLEGNTIGKLQAFNQIVHRKVYQHYSGCDETFKSADDRELAARIRSEGGQIIFSPNTRVFHHYNFTFFNILKRKYIHGVWAEAARHKYQERTDIYLPRNSLEKLRYIGSIFAAPSPFNSTYKGRIYYGLSTIAYESGCLYSKLNRFCNEYSQSMLHKTNTIRELSYTDLMIS